MSRLNELLEHVNHESERMRQPTRELGTQQDFDAEQNRKNKSGGFFTFEGNSAGA